MKCCIDIDGVLGDFPKHVAYWFNKPYRNEYITPESYKMSSSQFYGQLDYAFWISMPLTREAKELVALVREHFEDSCILTAPIQTTGCRQGKHDWIKKNFPAYEHKSLVGACKEFCASPDTVLIDDNDKNIETFRKAGGLGITFPRPWNKTRDLDPLVYVENRIRAMLREEEARTWKGHK
jgi:5'(3')-deoxyribonucleotidase